jgi:hypothetical protein
MEPGERSRYSDWLPAARQTSRSSSPGNVNNVLFFTSSRPALVPSYTIGTGEGAFSPQEKRPASEADHSLPTNAEVKKIYSYTSTPPYVFMALRSA